MEKFNVANLVNNDGCFDLQFRKDTRHERTNSPTYYRWKAQFIVTLPKTQEKLLAKVKKEMGCGSVSTTANQARFAVQKIDDSVECIIPYFQKHKLLGNKKRDFDLWQKAVSIIWQNKGIYLSKWKRNDLMHLMEIHKAMAKSKQKPRQGKWIKMASTISKKEAA